MADARAVIVLNCHSETPLHYACVECQPASCKFTYIQSRGTSVITRDYNFSETLVVNVCPQTKPHKLLMQTNIMELSTCGY